MHRVYTITYTDFKFACTKWNWNAHVAKVNLPINLGKVLTMIVKKKLNVAIVLSYIEREKKNNNFTFMIFLLYWRQATQSAPTWHDYPSKSCTAVIHDMTTRDLESSSHYYCIICIWMTSQALISRTQCQSDRTYLVQCIIMRPSSQ